MWWGDCEDGRAATVAPSWHGTTHRLRPMAPDPTRTRGGRSLLTKKGARGVPAGGGIKGSFVVLSMMGRSLDEGMIEKWGFCERR